MLRSDALAWLTRVVLPCQEPLHADRFVRPRLPDRHRQIGARSTVSLSYQPKRFGRGFVSGLVEELLANLLVVGMFAKLFPKLNEPGMQRSIHVPDMYPRGTFASS